MASRPPDPNAPPESIVLGVFKGIRNTVSRERLGLGDLESAVNVDLDDTGQARRRRGYSLQLAGNCHSLRTIGGRVLGVKDGVLGIVNPDFTFTSLGRTVGPDPLAYTQVDQTTYFSSLTASGKVTGTTVEDWGAVDSAGTWVSPVITPSDTLGEVFGKFIHAPPMAQDITTYNGRIYLSAGKYLWATELFLYDYVERTKGFVQFEAEITMLAAVNDGLYVGTESGLYFLKGTLAKGLAQTKIVDAAVIRGSAAYLPSTEIHPAARQGDIPEGTAVVFMTDRGICAGFDGGQVLNLTYDRIGFPGVASAAALYREDIGGSHYVAVTDSAGGVAANVRIGDYVEAEIIRAADQ